MSKVMLNLIVILSVGFFSLTGFSKPEENANTSVLMRQFLDHLKKLTKYSMSEEKFGDPKNTLEISTQLHEFAKVAKEASHDPLLKHDNFKFSQQVLENHIAETEKIFKGGNKNFARWMLNSTMSVCMSCHAQMPGPSKTFFEFEQPQNYYSEFEQAEFLFATRDFEKASAMYDKIINRNLKFDDKFQVERSLERQLAYYSRIKRDPTGAIKKFKTYLKAPGLTEKSQRDIKEWLKQFQSWEKQAYFDPKKMTEKDILTFAKKHLDAGGSNTQSKSADSDLVTHLYVSGVLYEYLYSHAKVQATPDILYWLAVSDRFINHNFFYSLADLYLRECIINYSTRPIAKNCYAEYEKEMTLSHSGSSGTNLPLEVVQDLKNLKQLINTQNKTKLNKN